MKRICNTEIEVTMVVSGCALQDSFFGAPCTLLHVGIASNSTNTKKINADRVRLSDSPSSLQHTVSVSHKVTLQGPVGIDGFYICATELYWTEA